MRPLWLVPLALAADRVRRQRRGLHEAEGDRLDGSTIASRANDQLEKENPSMVPGDLTCADVEFEVGASSRCVRTVVLEDGRLVRIGATVTIDRTAGGGHFKVKIDEKPQEFGVTGKAVLADITKQYAAKYGGKAPTGTCPPYLAGTKVYHHDVHARHVERQADGAGHRHHVDPEELHDGLHLPGRALTARTQ